MTSESSLPASARVANLSWSEVDAQARRACVDLWHLVWPDDDPAGPAARLARTDPIYAALDAMQLHLAYDGTSLRAVARTFLHAVTLDGNPVEIVALASVCSDPNHRGQGWGDAVVNAAFERVDSEGRPAFFQSPVPKYYERFGARTVQNKIFTSIDGADAFSDPWAMIYPGDSSWEDTARIDLCAPGW